MQQADDATTSMLQVDTTCIDCKHWPDDRTLTVHELKHEQHNGVGSVHDACDDQTEAARAWLRD